MFNSWQARVAVLAVVAAMAGPVLALASPVGAAGGGANHLNGPCSLLNYDASAIVTGTAHRVVTPSGNANDVCQATGLDNPTGAAVILTQASTGDTCTTPAGVADNWHETISADGNATLTCKEHG